MAQLVNNEVLILEDGGETVSQGDIAWILGGSGNDVIYGERIAAGISGEGGNDRIEAVASRGVVNGGDGSDQIVLRQATNDLLVIGDEAGSGVGGDTIELLSTMPDLVEIALYAGNTAQAEDSSTDTIIIHRDALTGVPAGAQREINVWTIMDNDRVVLEGVAESEVAVTLSNDGLFWQVTAGNTVINIDGPGNHVPDITRVLEFNPNGGGGDPIGGLTKDEVLQVARLYEAGLGREPDRGGLNYWVDQREAGLDPNAMAASFLDSQEFTGRYGDDDTMTGQRFIDVMYTNVLGRLPDAQGYEFWVGQLDQGASREQVLRGFAQSQENQDQSAYLNDLTQVEPGTWWFA